MWRLSYRPLLATCAVPLLEIPSIDSQILHNERYDIVVDVFDEIWMSDPDGYTLIEAPVRLCGVRIILVGVVNLHGYIEPSKPGIPCFTEVIPVVVNVIKL